jgi:hypothetical protein
VAVYCPGLVVGEEREREINMAFDTAVEAVRKLQIAVSLVTENGVRLLARQTLPPLIPVFSGRVTEDGKPPTYDGMIQFFVPEGSASRFGLVPEAMTDEQAESLNRALFAVTGHSVFSAYVDLRREAMVQRHHDGNGRLAVMSLAAAGEVFLDTIIGLLLWEELVEPAVAAPLFAHDRSHANRVATSLPGRLRGDWDPKGRGAVGAYFQDLVYLRHRVIHVGHEPSPLEEEAAWNAMFGLERFVGDRLAADDVLPNFSRVAIMWLAEGGLRRRGKWNRRVRDLSVDRREPDWMLAFQRWRGAVDLLLDARSPTPGSDVSSIELFVRVGLDGSIEAVARDARTLTAAEVPFETLAFNGVERVRQAAETHFNEGGSEPFEVQVHGAADQLSPSTLSWLPERDLLPDLDPFPGPRRM